MPDSNTSDKTGATVYSRWFLVIYDIWVLRIACSFCWRCSTKKVLLPFFRQHIGKTHLDIGVGTGYLLANANVPKETDVTLADLNQNSLDVAARRFGRPVKRVLHDALEPLPDSELYDSISMIYLLHCIPGPTSRKMRVFENLKHNLSPDGVLYGATVLGHGVEHNIFGRQLLRILNKEGVMDNYRDSEKEFAEALRDNFQDVSVRIEGTVMFFVARNPRIAALRGKPK